MTERARKFSIPALLIVTLGMAASVGRADASSEITTWTAAESPYVLEADYVVPPGNTLVVEAGVEVRAEPGVRLVVRGAMVVQGTASTPVSFTVTDAEAERWGGIELTGGPAGGTNQITGAIVERAVEGVTVGAPTEIDGTRFQANLVGVGFANPGRDALVQRSVFENNRIAVSGYTRGVITLYQNDFWNNPTTLLPAPQPMYDCGSDEGIWNIRSNDILRGPTNSEFYSDDVRTPPGSAAGDYRVLASGNWWGTDDEDRIRGRMATGFDCCPAPAEEQIVWEPVATGPQTPYEPAGDNPDPDPESALHGDPGLVTKIRRPSHGACYEAAPFRSLRGGFGSGLGGPSKVTLAVRRKTRSGCTWWSNQKGTFVGGACGDQRWFRATVVEKDSRLTWRYRFASRLPRGRFMVWSYGFAEPSHRGRNEVAFRLR